VPIIALTANAMEGNRDRCLAAGMDDFLTKPFSQAQLSAMLKRWTPHAAGGLREGPRPATGAALPAAAGAPPVAAGVSLQSAAGARAAAAEKPAPASAVAVRAGEPRPNEMRAHEPRVDERRADERLGDTGSSGTRSGERHVIDANVLRDIMALGRPALLGSLIDLYLQHSPSLMEAIDAAARDERASGLGDALHTLKSSTANLGGARLAALLKECETLVNDGEVDAARAVLARIPGAYREFCEALALERSATAA
jgi:two-component system, sensor histidine kinase and response regulator